MGNVTLKFIDALIYYNKVMEDVFPVTISKGS